jgi:hypothetical protein
VPGLPVVPVPIVVGGTVPVPTVALVAKTEYRNQPMLCAISTLSHYINQALKLGKTRQ